MGAGGAMVGAEPPIMIDYDFNLFMPNCQHK